MCITLPGTHVPGYRLFRPYGTAFDATSTYGFTSCATGFTGCGKIWDWARQAGAKSPTHSNRFSARLKFVP
jgi:hypothetical protein